MPARIVPQLFDHALQPVHQVLDVAISGSAFVVAATAAAAEDASRTAEIAACVAAEEGGGGARVGWAGVVASAWGVGGARAAVGV